MSSGHYTQVTMRGLGAAAGRVYTAWIPSGFARVGKLLKIDGRPGVWRVDERHDTVRADWIEERSRDYLHQREASDV